MKGRFVGLEHVFKGKKGVHYKCPRYESFS